MHQGKLPASWFSLSYSWKAEGKFSTAGLGEGWLSLRELRLLISGEGMGACHW